MDGMESKVSEKESQYRDNDKHEEAVRSVQKPAHEDDTDWDMPEYEGNLEIRRQSLENAYKHNMDTFNS